MKTLEKIKRSKQPLARPISVLVPLIKADIRDGDTAAEEASMPYYIAAGEKLLEVKAGGQVKGQFTSWATNTFKRSKTQIASWMRVAKLQKSSRARTFTTIDEAVRPGYNQGRVNVTINRRLVDDIKRAHPEMAERVQQREEEREQLELDVALELISIGYRALAAKLHPDRNNGGSHDAMRTLNTIRDALKRFANSEWGR
jgi:hypothetical protein